MKKQKAKRKAAKKETAKITTKITKNMTISEVASKYPKTAAVFEKHGLHCIGCPMAMQETIAEVAMHSVNIKRLLKELNDAIGK